MKGNRSQMLIITGDNISSNTKNEIKYKSKISNNG